MHDPETFSTPLLASPEQRARLLRRELKEKQAWIEAKRVAEREEYKALGNGRTIQKRAEDKLTFI